MTTIIASARRADHCQIGPFAGLIDDIDDLEREDNQRGYELDETDTALAGELAFNLPMPVLHGLDEEPGQSPCPMCECWICQCPSSSVFVITASDTAAWRLGPALAPWGSGESQCAYCRQWGTHPGYCEYCFRSR